MKAKKLTSKSGRVRELKREDIRAMRSANDVLPHSLANLLPKRKRGERGPQKEPKKILITLRYSPEVVDYFKNSGQGWQTRINTVLEGYVKRHQRSSRHHLK